MMLACGLHYPIATAIIGAVYFLARVMFQVGYKIVGPKGRMMGAMIVMPIQFGFPIFTIVSCFQFATTGILLKQAASL